jgi:hypothetical protein
MDFLRHNQMLFHLFFGMLLTLVYPMQELFSGNQNIYFLWAMEQLQPGTFANDPLISTADPYPLFTWMITLFPADLLHVWSSFVYALLNAVYSFALFGIADSFARIYRHSSRWLTFSVFFLFLHSSPIWGTYMNLISGFDLRWVWDSGIAEQGVLRGYLQPSVFGVFLLLSFHFAVKRNFAWAILAVVPAAIIHANYLFLGGVLTMIYLATSRFEKRSVLAAGASLILILPYIYYLHQHFVALEYALKSAIDQAILAGYEENIHLNPKNWLNAKLTLQLLAVGIAVLLTRNLRIGKLIMSVLVIATGVTLIAYFTNNITLISLNPWRLSVVLIPVSVAAILVHLTRVSGKSLSTIGASIILKTSFGIVTFRLFGNGSDQFMIIWSVIQIPSLLILLLGFNFLNKWPPIVKIGSWIAVISLIIVGAVDHYIDDQTKTNSDQFQAIEALKGMEPNTVYVVPPDWTCFRLNAQKAVFVDENLVYGPALPELMQRLQFLQTSDFDKILASIPSDVSVKLIAPTSPQTDEPILAETITENYTCYVIRQ